MPAMAQGAPVGSARARTSHTHVSGLSKEGTTHTHTHSLSLTHTHNKHSSTQPPRRCRRMGAAHALLELLPEARGGNLQMESLSLPPFLSPSLTLPPFLSLSLFPPPSLSLPLFPLPLSPTAHPPGPVSPAWRPAWCSSTDMSCTATAQNMRQTRSRLRSIDTRSTRLPRDAAWLLTAVSATAG